MGPIFGRKRVHLAPPSDAALLRAASGFYSNLVHGQPEDQAELRATPLLKVDLDPGDALFIPSMWWHHVQGLDPFTVLVNYWWTSMPAWIPTPMHASTPDTA